MNLSFNECGYFNIDPQFDRDFWHYEENRKLYQGIIDCHVTQSWKVIVQVNGRHCRGRVKTLAEAVEMRDRFKGLRNVK